MNRYLLLKFVGAVIAKFEGKNISLSIFAAQQKQEI